MEFKPLSTPSSQTASPPDSRAAQYQYPFKTAGMGPLPEILLRPASVGCAALQAAFDSVYSLDRLLVHYGHLLDLLQPSAPGKLAIRFPRTATRRDDERAPVLGAWHRVGDRWRFRPLPDYSKALRARKRYGPFRATFTEVGEVLQHVRELLRRRDALAGICRAAQRGLQLNAAQARSYAMQAEKQWSEMLPVVLNRRDEAIVAWHAAAEARSIGETLSFKPYFAEAASSAPTPPRRPRQSKKPKA